MDQELLLRASFFQKQAEEIEGNVNLIEKQLDELDEFKQSIDYISAHPIKEVLSPVGKGVYLKTSLDDKKLFVEVGAGVVVKKTPAEAKQIVEGQLSKLNEARVQLMAQLEVYYNHLRDIIRQIEKEKS